MQALSKQAAQFLADGLNRAKDRDVDAVIANAALAQAQIKLADGDPDVALELLAADKIGPQRLVAEKHPAVQTDLFVEQTYRTQLKALVARLAQGAQAEETIEQAQEVMSRLQRTADADPDGQRRLVGIYVDLAKDLRRQIDEVDDEQQDKIDPRFRAVVGSGGRSGPRPERAELDRGDLRRDGGKPARQ